ncbi:4Fe-4S dicluster domain-containing protein [Desulfosporosinus meridiei]|uniref:Fe-S-cluster-containing hydrogenase subunit n=1 Tax=Desulfosporosinus meridiei (strain ATCC BAA-275 / DSM 13257 / KCTC 12902 / NCIMB 13706 / S10) TaxID=768704 RepID=J7IXA0_DESMD|nr:4Fe-4S dicluster domain-containing protein [Desulfosporosinus meridiei]AFQ43758.1 Fe-S-cluster-containing hydrogenase subunit [Desulfosporosinus meridiei DSM 13257]
MRQILAKSEHCLGCKSCELACAVAHSASKTLFQAISELPPPQKRIFVECNGEINLPLQCRQCIDAPCVDACMSGAMQFDLTTGLIQVDDQRCVGCMMCVMVCPFGAITEITATRRVTKCDRCRELYYDPACVSACPTKALEFVEVETFAQRGRKTFLDQMKGVN